MIYLPDDTIPAPLYDALTESNKEYGKELSEFMAGREDHEHSSSVTALATPTQKALLIRRHSKDIYIAPLKECWHALLGNIVHYVLEKHAAKNLSYMTEVRMDCSITVDGIKCLLHGKFDLYNRDTFTLQDWKLTSASNMMYPKDAYEMQLNVLRFILMRNNYRVDKLENIYLFPHLDKAKMNMKGYPQTNALPVDVKLKPISEVEKYIKNRLRVQLTESKKEDRELTPCTDEERWVRNSYWAIYTRKKGGKKGVLQDFSSRAASRADTKKELIEWRKANNHEKENVEYRHFKGTPIACSFCQAKVVCKQYLKEVIELEKQQQHAS